MASAQIPFQRNVQSTTERYIAPCGIQVFTYVGDINAVPGATAAVTGEGKEFADQSFITQSLIKTCPELHRKRDKLKKKYVTFKSWTVRTSKLDHESKFRYIFHAVLGRRKDEYWVEGMKKLYEALFKKAEKYKVTTLALPLLGSGRAGAEVPEAIQAITESITLMPKYRHLNKIYLVTLDKQYADKMATLCQKNFLNPSDVPSRLRRSLRSKWGFGGPKYRESKKRNVNKNCTNSQDKSHSNQSTSNTFPRMSKRRQQSESGSIGRNTSQSRPALTPLSFTVPQHQSQPAHNAQYYHQEANSHSFSTQNAQTDQQISYQEFKLMHTVQVHGPKQPTKIVERQQSPPPQNVSGQTQKAFERDHHLSPQLENAKIHRKGGHEIAQLKEGQQVRENRNSSEGDYDLVCTKRSGPTRNNGDTEGFRDKPERQTRGNYITFVDVNRYRQEGNYQAMSKNQNYRETGNRRMKETNTENRVSKNDDEHRTKRKETALEVNKKNATPENKKVASSLNAEHQSLSINCPICLNQVEDPKTLEKCGHVFCRTCIERSFSDFKPVCPSCNMVYGEIRGNQPDGQMDVGFSGEHLPGYEGHGTITITYYFPSGTQGKDHPNPGEPYKGTTRRAYLPDSKEGKAVLKLLRKAFDRRLIFTIGRSTTTGQENVVTWNDVHHKTSKDGGPTRFGYPDPGYLARLRDELAAKGVKEEKAIPKERQGKMETTF